jgi:hypothetical protein
LGQKTKAHRKWDNLSGEREGKDQSESGPEDHRGPGPRRKEAEEVEPGKVIEWLLEKKANQKE